MWSRPIRLILVSIALVFVAIAFPIQIMFVYEHGFDEFSSVIEKLSILNWIVIMGSLFNATLVWNASPWLRYSIPSLIGAVALNNLIVGIVATDFSWSTTTIATLGFALLAAPLLHPQILFLVKNPHRRWWLQAERRCVHAPIYLGFQRTSLRMETYDLSETGAFVPIQENPKLDTGGAISVCLTLGALLQIRCQARIVRRTDAKGKYPAGIGIQFVDLPWQHKRELRRYLDHQPKAISY